MLVTLGGCSPSSEEHVSVPLLEGTWRNSGTAYRYYDAQHKLIGRDSTEGRPLGSITFTSTVIQLYRDGGEPMEEPWPYERHGDTIQFPGGHGYWTILELTSHRLVTKVEVPYPVANKTGIVSDATISYHVR